MASPTQVRNSEQDISSTSKTGTATKTRTSAEQHRILHDAEMSRHSVTILKDPETIFQFFRNFENFPLFMKDISEVRMVSPTVSHWVVQMSHGPSIEWDAEIIAERPNEMISWQSIGDSDVKQAGSIWLIKAPGERGTIVRLAMKYTVPGGKLIEMATKMIGEDPDTLIMMNLKRLKAYLETGEIPTIEGQPSGRDEDSHPVLTH